MTSINKIFSIYVIELNPKVLGIKKFRDKNPDYLEGKPCVYVGFTSKTPKERFAEHKIGLRSGPIKLHNTYAYKFGMRLKPRLYQHQNNQSSQVTEEGICSLAKLMRYHVYQNYKPCQK